MGIKKRLTSGAIAATLGISLIGVGTWAAFNDVENVEGGVAAGTLELSLNELNGQPVNFDISNLKPGDHMTRQLQLKNDGSLAIKDVLLSIETVDFQDYAPNEPGMPGYEDEDTWGENTVVDYLNQFEVTIMNVGNEGSGDGEFPKNIILENVSLGDFYLASGTIHGDRPGEDPASIQAARERVWNSVDQAYIDVASNRLNVSTVNPDQWTGLPVDPYDPDNVLIKIAFKDDQTKNEDGTYVQNKYQGDAAAIEFMFEARQWDGQDVSDEEGYVESNEQANNGN
ncbi:MULTISPECIES: TasA family protein [unclassified Virgibacillus]|uniref:TasA family protein n=1 Tax=unclassified Virgibacillus TaxID=2620237 RepID=UPI0024DE86A5|nr:TasA family protein [Virgibacillus sp. LDC-1]